MISSAQAVWLALIVAQIAVVLPLVILWRKVVIIPSFQPVLDELNALPDAIAAKVAAAGTVLPEGAASAQDVSDTLAAVQTAADAAKTSAAQ